MSLSSNFPTAMPGLNLDFINATSLDPRITFTRALNTATYFNSAGVLTTANANVPRFDYDPVTLAPRGLLIEEQRTNLFLYSQEFNNAYWTLDTSTISANAIAAPDGTTTADRLVVNNGATNGSINRALTVSSATAYTLSCFVKSDGAVNWVQFIATGATGVSPARLWCNISTGVLGTNNGGFTNASIASFGSGWYRITATYTTSSTSSVYYFANADADNVNGFTGNGVNGAYFWGAQLEAGSFATSYIPTTGSSATRNADNAVMTGTNFSSWFNQGQGTFFADADTLYSNAADAVTIRTVFAADDGAYNNLHRIYQYTNKYGGNTVFAGVNQSDIPLSAVAANTPAKTAYAYAVNDFSAAMNGVLGTPDTSGTLPSPTRLSFGLLPVNGHIRRITYYPTRLSNALMQTLTGS